MDIAWAPGVHPADDEPVLHYVMIDVLRGGPYILSEQQHTFLHEENAGHQHVTQNDFVLRH